MTSEETKAIVRRFYNDVWNNFNLSIVDKLFAPDYIVHNLPLWRKPGTKGLKDFIADNHRMFPDVHHEIKDLIADGDKVVVRFIATGTHKAKLNGPLGVIPATNRKVQWDGISILRLKDGKIVEVWGLANNLDLMKQLGAIPSNE